MRRSIATLVTAFLTVILLTATPASAISFAQETKLAAADAAANDQFGYAVALRSDTLVVGARGEGDNFNFYGAVYLFRRINGSWTQVAKLAAADPGNNDLFGVAVAINSAEDTIVVGAPQDDDNGAESGSIYIFREVSGVWTQEAKLTAPDGAANDQFGYAVAIDGANVLAGAPFDDGAFTDSGSVYLAHWGGASWSAATKLTPSDLATNTRFGIAVALNGDTAVVGAQRGTVSVGASGSAYVFRDNGGSWNQEAELAASDAASSDSFGHAVAIDGNTIAVGAPLNDDNGTSTGSAYIFERIGTTWSEQAKLLGNDIVGGFQFGSAVALYGGTVVVGAFNDSHAGTSSGSAYVFEHNGFTWSHLFKVTASDAQTDDRFGNAVAISADTVAIGAYGEDTAGSNAGAVYLYADANQPPVADPGGPYTASEGTSITFDGTNSTDPEGNALSYAWSFGDGAFDSEPAPSHTYADNGAHEVCLTVADPGGLTDTACTTAQIANETPVVTVDGPTDVSSGGNAAYSATVVDPGLLDGHTVTWDCDGDGFDDGAGLSVTCTFPTGPALVTVRAQATDTDGASGTGLLPITVAAPVNSAPIADPGGPYAGLEGAPVDFSGDESSDPDGDSLTYVWDFGDGAVETGPAPSHTYADDGDYQVCLAVTDSAGAADTACLSATIANVAPVAGPINVSGYLREINTLITAELDFSDPGTSDTHTVQWDWGDGTVTAGTVSETSGAGAASGSHAYTTPGVYTIIVIVTDKDASASTPVEFQFVVVYDPTAGYVTGGGWFQSPPEACPEFCGGVSGKANFGFQARYKRGANVPTGQTQFRFKAGNLDFDSNTYDWLVVAGPHAKFKGEGAINGSGGYRFMVTATDGQVNGGGGADGFRIKIWNDDDVVYDNQWNEGDDSNATTALGGGSIQIHSTGVTSAQNSQDEPDTFVLNNIVFLPVISR